ncbi:thiamine phosphate synthase [Fictibacillus nanhaiensis]|uniref:Thiamine-phosphate synthase n=1 Tax=Fictibacillus nanhaiensis TaxID=742169 RepID=A0ABS2ZQ69_9BACL|nr:thiamine phosphate synthase [Fictibacillus nanhaiensis]
MNTQEMSRLQQDLSLYFVAGTMNCHSPEEFYRILKQAVQGGITAFQFREKGVNSLSGQKQLEMAKRAKEVCHKHDVLFIVNDDLDLMKAVGADGLHVGQTDGNLRDIRRETEGKLLGVSAHTLAEAKDAIVHGADYIGVGPIYQTRTKSDAKKPVGVDLILELRSNHINVPLVGIGGITLQNAGEVIKAGADGVAIISAISGAVDPSSASSNLLQIIYTAKRES